MSETIKKYNEKFKIFEIENFLGKDYKITNYVGDSYEIFHNICKTTQIRTRTSLKNSVYPGCKFCFLMKKENYILKRFMGTIGNVLI